MKVSGFRLVGVWIISLVLVLPIPIANAAESIARPGGECAKLGEIQNLNSLQYKCKAATKYVREVYGYKYIWSKGKLTSTTSPKPGESFDGRKYGDGAVVGRDIKPGRYWSINCYGWQHFGDNGTISRSLKTAQQSLVDLRVGETLLSNCKWYLGEPPNAKVLPTGKLSMKTQLVPGRYRAVGEICMTGPTDTRSTYGITAELDSKDLLIWETLPKGQVLVITGNENWTAYGVTIECGGLTRLD